MDPAASLSSRQRALLELRLRQKSRGAGQLQPGPRGPEPGPLSFSQERMWLLWRLEPEVPVYNSSLCLRFRGALNVPFLERALNEIWRRHDVLRAHFPAPDGQPTQIARPWAPEPLASVNLEHGGPAVRETELENLARRVVLEPYDLEAGPVTRRLLVRLSPEEHVLLLGFHHIVFDAWSRHLLQGELERLYTALTRGEASSLPELPIQYADFARWQRQQSDAPRQKAALDYWCQHLAGDLPVLALPIARPLAARRTFQGAEVKALLPAALIRDLKALARQEGATLFMGLLAALKTLFQRYTGQEDFIVGSPVAGRTLAETEPLLGCLVNTLAIRSRPAPSQPFRAALQAERDAVLAAMEHQTAPFERVVERLHPTREWNRAPIFQAMLNLRNVPAVGARWEHLEVVRWDFDTGVTQFDLLLEAEETEDGLAVNCRFSTELFEAAGMRRFLDHWRVLLEGMVARPDARLCELPLLTEHERHQWLVEWNQTTRPYPRDRCVHELFEEQARARPDAPAVYLREERWTYGELDRRAEVIADRLQSLSIAPDQLVGLCVERSLEMAAALLGILKAGGAYWPLDAAWPDERMALLLATARPAVLLVSADRLERFRSLAARERHGSARSPVEVLAIEDIQDSAFEVSLRHRPTVGPEHLAYVMFTSGSTGRPKGVMVPHRGVVRLVKNTNYASLSSDETLLHLAPLSFDASTFEIWGALLNGGRLALLPPGPPALADIGDAIRRHHVTTLWLTASLFHLMVEERLEDLRPLRQLLAGGDVLSPSHVVRALRGLPGCRLINGYGPTENTTFTCCHTLHPAEDGSRAIPIGQPIAQTQVYVLDPHRQPVPAGVPGELYAAGDGLARGYLAESERTAECFLPDPFSTTPGARMYRTGDLVRRRADGTLEFLGRLDRQVKIRGFRVELEEIEAALLECPGVREAAVVFREVAGERQLVGYVVPESGHSQSADVWREHLQKRLPAELVPALFMPLASLPRSVNQKIDRAALPAPEPEPVSGAEKAGDPVSLLELELLRLWQRLFGRSDIGREDNFFDLGGHSLMAARFVAEVERLLKHRIPLALLFRAPTVASLARLLRDEQPLPAWTSLVPLQPLGQNPPLFFLHGVGGSVYKVLNLARSLAPEQPAYGLQAVGLDGHGTRHRSLEEMAAHYVQEISSLQPEGPYYLAGYSLGGWVAFEVAQQLSRQGRPVAMLALLDTGPVGPVPWWLDAATTVLHLAVRPCWHLKRCLTLPAAERRTYLAERWKSLGRMLTRWIQRNRRFSLPDETPSTREAGCSATDGLDYYHRVTRNYVARPFEGTVDLFLGEGKAVYMPFFWRHMVRHLRVHPLRGDHSGVIAEENLKSLSQVFRTALRDARHRAARF